MPALLAIIYSQSHGQKSVGGGPENMSAKLGKTFENLLLEILLLPVG